MSTNALYHAFNSSPPSAISMCQWIGSALIQIMVSSHYLNQCWDIVNWILRNNLHWNFNQNTKLFIHKNASETIVCEMAAMSSRGRWVKEFCIQFALCWVLFWLDPGDLIYSLQGCFTSTGLSYNFFSVTNPTLKNTYLKLPYESITTW